MALREIWDFTNVPSVGVGSISPFLPKNTYLGYTGGGGQSNGPSLGITIDSNNATWLYTSCPGNSNGTYIYTLNINYANVSDFTTRRSYIGIRLLTTYFNISIYTAPLLLWNSSSQYQALIPYSSIIAGSTLAQAQYFEVMIDRANKQLVYWLNNVYAGTVYFDFDSFIGTGTAKLQFFSVFNQLESRNGTAEYFKDVYFVDDTQDGTICDRLGPINTTGLSLATASAPNWTSSDSAGALSDLNTVLGTTATTQTLPVITEPATEDPISLTFNTSKLINKERIAAVIPTFSGTRTAGSLFLPATSMQLGSDVIQNGTFNGFTPAPTMVYNQNGLPFEKAPDGTEWTATNLGESSLILTP